MRNQEHAVMARAPGGLPGMYRDHPALAVIQGRNAPFDPVQERVLPGGLPAPAQYPAPATRYLGPPAQVHPNPPPQARPWWRRRATRRNNR